MKVMQIMNDLCHWQTPYKTIAETAGLYAPDIQFVEAPDHVFEGWGYLDGEFIRPTPPDGWLYDDATGTFYREGDATPELSVSDAGAAEIATLKAELTATDYKAIKYAEGWLTEEEYAPVKAQRQGLRDQINRLEASNEQVH